MSSLRRAYLVHLWGMTIGEGTRISLKARLDFTNPSGVHIGDYTMITPDVHVFSHDFLRGQHIDTKIGSNCFVGAGAIVLPGITIGDRCIIAAGSVVNKDIPDRSLVAGNPAKIVRSDIKTGRYGMLAGPTVS